jgi:protein FAM50
VSDYSKAVAASTSSSFLAKSEGDDDRKCSAADASGRLSQEERAKQLRAEKKSRKARLKEKKKMLSTLSFANDDDDLAIDEPAGAKQRVQKDSTVDTSFLPDPERDERIAQERQRLQKEWHAQQEQVKQERLEITYSYWDGSGHRRNVTVRKGNTIGEFLELVRKDLCKEFRELVNVSSDALLYVKEDLIIPSDMTFYDLIVTRARGKSGPLFHFDVHDDVRTGAIDSRIEKDESHPGKVSGKKVSKRDMSQWSLIFSHAFVR